MNSAVEKLKKCFLESQTIKSDFTSSYKEILENIIWTNDDTKRLFYYLFQQGIFPKQHFSYGSFGNPNFTLFRENDLFMDVYFWPESKLSIHNHHFEGAFKVLSGKVLSIKYDFQVRKVGEFISIGDLKILEQKNLKTNTVEEVRPYEDLIHTIKHLQPPGVTLLLRRNDFRDQKLSIYLYPDLKVDLGEVNEDILFKKVSLAAIDKTNFFLNEKEMLFILIYEKRFRYVFANHKKALEIVEEILSKSKKLELGQRVLKSLISNRDYQKKLERINQVTNE